MTTYNTKILDILKRYTAIGVQVTNSYNTEQASLRLDLTISRERLYSKEGTQESLATIARLVKITNTYKERFQHLILAQSNEHIAALAELPDAEKHVQAATLAEALNRQLALQNEFYAAQDQWIDAATRICNLVESCRDTAIFADAVQFAEDAQYDEFEQQIARIEDAHLTQVQLMNKRLGWLEKSCAELGVQLKRS